MIGLFITGTDTGVGKTLVTAGIARALRQQGHEVRVCKPVATGASWVDGRWLSEDTAILADAAGLSGQWELVTPWAFPDPVAPPVAAQRSGSRLRLAEITAAVRQRRKPGAALLVEGVGGLLCPLTEQETVADLVAELRLPLIVVARRSLGTLNHTLLTLEVAHHRGLAVAGVIVNEVEPAQGLAAATNVEELRRRIDRPVLVVLPHEAPSGKAIETALGQVAWWQVCQGLGQDDE
jgi:dethiobiotin synthetase